MLTHNYYDIISMENLLTVWEHFLRGKRHKKDVAEFQANLAENLTEIFNALRNKTYKHGLYSAFNISDPKPRNIHKATVRDRIVHHLIYEALYPYFEKKFIYDSYSCRENKGVHRALNRFKYFAGKVSQNHTRTCYVLKCDIKKFFAHIDHEILKGILKRQIKDKNIIWLLSQIINSFCVHKHIYAIADICKIGLPLGNLTSQLLVNVYMHEFDMFVKQELKVKYYIRYADDFVILQNDKMKLTTLLPKISHFLNEDLGLSLHPNKVSIETFASGVDFLGWVQFPYHRVLRTTTKRRMLKNIKNNPKWETIQSYLGMLGHRDGYKIRQDFIFDNVF